MAPRVEAYSSDRVREHLAAELPGWSFGDNAIRRAFETDGWPSTLMAVNALGYVAEIADHHPDLVVGWGKIEVSLSTHHAGGVTDKDFELAKRIEDALLWRPGPDSAFTATSRSLVRPADRG